MKIPKIRFEDSWAIEKPGLVGIFVLFWVNQYQRYLLKYGGVRNSRRSLCRCHFCYICVLILLYVSSYCYICVLICVLIYCTPIYASSLSRPRSLQVVEIVSGVSLSLRALREHSLYH